MFFGVEPGNARCTKACLELQCEPEQEAGRADGKAGASLRANTRSPSSSRVHDGAWRTGPSSVRVLKPSDGPSGRLSARVGEKARYANLCSA